ncbi:tudor domain-containing protein [Microvirga sp. 2MCAF35]|uniref:tudor domain-containing protein n=1 Tax=Microvirga sp. 2MCAF35 TaxID=3232987 RepID=UPI003F97EB84
MANKPTDEKAASATLIVFGPDETGKPHASWFDEADAPLAEKAAGLMKMKILRLTTDEQKKLAGRLPQGRVFESGKAFVPFVNRTLYAQLAAMGGEIPEIDPALLEAALNADAAKTSKGGGKAAIPEGLKADAGSWAYLAVGSIVLANETPGEGWYEAIVKEVKAEGLYLLTWRDWPHEAAFVRKAPHIALLHPANSK